MASRIKTFVPLIVYGQYVILPGDVKTIRPQRAAVENGVEYQSVTAQGTDIEYCHAAVISSAKSSKHGVKPLQHIDDACCSVLHSS